MRIWDISPRLLCRQHLLGEHRELHAIWAILTKGRFGYRNHPETKRWVGALKGLYVRHEKLMKEMSRRGYRHASKLDKKDAVGRASPQGFVDSIKKQRKILRKKGCQCQV